MANRRRQPNEQQVPIHRMTKKEAIRSLIKNPKQKFLTESQKKYWDLLDNNQITICSGPAGVGKSYIAMMKAVELLWRDDNKYEKIIIVRPAVEAEEKLGSLPGGVEEKLPFQSPLCSNLHSGDSFLNF